MWKSTGKIAKEHGVTNQAVQYWIKIGKYEKTRKTKGGHWRIWIENDPKIILYARVSSSKQKSSIKTQRDLLEAKYPGGEFISDIASGFNQDRRGYKRILELALNQTPLHVVATTSDRITRSGFSLIKWIVELHGGRIELLEEKNNPEQFDTTTLIAFITSFINSHYGKRSAKRRKEKAISKDDC